MPSLTEDILKQTTPQKQATFLITLFEEAIKTSNLGQKASADDLIDELARYVRENVNLKELNQNTLPIIYNYLNTWEPDTTEDTGESFGKKAYICTSVQGTLLCILSENITENRIAKSIELISGKCLKYLEELECAPSSKLIEKKRAIVSDAHNFLIDTRLSDEEKVSLFYEKISDNQAIFNQEQHPRAILFLKTVAVFVAFCIGVGIGGVLAYQKLFDQKNKEKTKNEQFKLSIFQPVSNDIQTSEEKQDHKDTSQRPSPN